MSLRAITTAKTHAPDGSKTISQIHREHSDWVDDQPIVTLCGFCDWRFEGTALDARVAAQEHREQAHPDVAKRRRGGAKQRKTETINAAKARRADREEQDRLASIERGRRRVLEEVGDAARLGPDGAPASSSSGLAEVAANHPDVESDAPEPSPAPDTAATSSSPLPGTVAAEIVAALADGPMRHSEIRRALGRSDGAVSAHLNTQCRRGRVVRLARGLYGLPGSVAPEPENVPTGGRPPQFRRDAVVALGLAYYERTGMMPTRGICDASESDLPSYSVIRRLFAGTLEFHNAIAAAQRAGGGGWLAPRDPSPAAALTPPPPPRQPMPETLSLDDPSLRELLLLMRRDVARLQTTTLELVALWERTTGKPLEDAA